MAERQLPSAFLNGMTPNQLRLLFDEFPDGIALFSAKGLLHTANQEFFRLIGLANFLPAAEDDSTIEPQNKPRGQSEGEDAPDTWPSPRGEVDSAEGELKSCAITLHDLLIDPLQAELMLELLGVQRVVRSFSLDFSSFDGEPIHTLSSVVSHGRAEDFVLHVRDIVGVDDHVSSSRHANQVLDTLLPMTAGKGLLESISATTAVLEKYYIERALGAAKGNRAAAARRLGVSRQSLYIKMNRYGIGEPLVSQRSA